jgi:rhodanese-related sulfurtransferase
MAVGVPRMSKDELKQRLTESDLTIIDLRLNYDQSSLTIPHAKRENPQNVDSWAGGYDSTKPMILYCSSPNEKTSAEAAARLIELGFSKVCVLKGGWVVWQSSNFPVHDKLTDSRPQGVVTRILKDEI